MPTGRMPSVGLELRRFRDLKYYEPLFEPLAKQFEMAKLDEARDAVVIQVVDKALQPERKSGLKRALIVILATAIRFLLSIALVFVLEQVKRPPH